MYLYENRDQRWNNEDVFYLLRYAISGKPAGAPTGEIAEVIGLKQVILRCQNTVEHLKK